MWALKWQNRARIWAASLGSKLRLKSRSQLVRCLCRIQLEGHSAQASACMKLFKEWNHLGTSSLQHPTTTYIKQCTTRIQIWRHRIVIIVSSTGKTQMELFYRMTPLLRQPTYLRTTTCLVRNAPSKNLLWQRIIKIMQSNLQQLKLNLNHLRNMVVRKLSIRNCRKLRVYKH